jgi:Ser/Thr protein kinase RdoA (MazF antagonist)
MNDVPTNLTPHHNDEDQFYNLGPADILDAVEQIGVRATGKTLALNSYENRVYQVEIELPAETITSTYDTYRVIKFYRPKRWSEEQIREEHALLDLLRENDIPVIAPLPFDDGDSLRQLAHSGLFFCIYKKFGGRHRAELPDSELKTVGRLLARTHNIAQQIPTRTRLTLNAETYGRANMELLLDSPFIPEESKGSYRNVVEPILQIASQRLQAATSIRIHGDCHLGNVLWQDESPFLLDFDDMVYGPAVQDIWLLNPGRDEASQERQDKVIEAYCELRDFPHQEVSLIEPLRALRIIHFEGWIARRWNDPIFQRTFEHFGTPLYWREELAALYEISDLLMRGS